MNDIALPLANAGLRYGGDIVGEVDNRGFTAWHKEKFSADAYEYMVEDAIRNQITSVETQADGKLSAAEKREIAEEAKRGVDSQWYTRPVQRLVTESEKNDLQRQTGRIINAEALPGVLKKFEEKQGGVIPLDGRTAEAVTEDINAAEKSGKDGPLARNVLIVLRQSYANYEKPQDFGQDVSEALGRTSNAINGEVESYVAEIGEAVKMEVNKNSDGSKEKTARYDK